MTTSSSLEKKDLLEIIEAIKIFDRCKTLSELKIAIKDHLFPLFDCNAALYGWLDTEQTELTTMDSINLDKQDLKTLDLFVHHDPATTDVFIKQNAITAYDVDLPRDEFKKEYEKFLEDRKENISDHKFFEKFQTGIIVHDPLHPDFGIGFHRLLPKTHKITHRDVKNMERVVPRLMRSIQCLILADNYFKETKKNAVATFVIKALLDRDNPIAVVFKNSKVELTNTAFENIFGLKAGNSLTGKLDEIFKGECTNLNRSSDLDLNEIKTQVVSDIHLPEGNFNFQLKHFKGEPFQMKDRFCIELTSIPDLAPLFHKALKKSGLTNKEVEVAKLVCDGASNDEIKDALFISKSTAQDHLKQLHE